MKTIVSQIALAILVTVATALITQAADQPNVLFIMADDFRPEIGSYGSTAITPNLDRLARRSLQFDRAYCQQAVCNPSRSSMLTGRRPDTLQVWSNSVHFREPNPDVATLPLWFKEHGYVTRCTGKIFHNWHTKIHGDPRSWSAPEFLHYANHGDDKPIVSGDLPPNLIEDSPRNYGASPLCECRDVPDEAYYDGRVAAEASKALGELGKSPQQQFFLAVGFWKPHAQFNAPKKYWDLYDRSKLPALNPAKPQGAPDVAIHDSREILGAPPKRVDLTPQQVAEMRHGYFANISYMDAQLGKVLDALQRSGAADRTIVVFCSDHGYHIGEHTQWGKTSNFELDAHVPLMIATPKMPTAGKRSSSLAELVDLFPTLVDLCGLPSPAGLEGTSLAPILRDPDSKVKPAAFTQHPRPAYFDREPDAQPKTMGVSVRTTQGRYTEWRNWKTGAVVAREFYPEAGEPAELRNAADDPKFAAARGEAESLLGKQFKPQPH